VIRVSLPTESSLSLSIYDILGQKVRTLLEEQRPAGYFDVEWDGKNDAGVRVGSGAYFYRAEATSSSGERRFSEMKKMAVVK